MSAAPATMVNLPLLDPPKTLFADIQVYESGRKQHRSVLSARNAVVPPANFITEQTLTLTAASPAVPYTFQGTPGNTCTVIAASAPIRMVVTRTTGVLDMGLQTIMILTSNVLAVALYPDAVNDTDVEIVHA
jgi:hypothetical protein